MKDLVASECVRVPMTLRDMIYAEVDARAIDRNRFLVARITSQGPLVEAYRNYEVAKRAVFHPAFQEVYLLSPYQKDALLKARDGVLEKVQDQRCPFCGDPAFESINQSVPHIKQLRDGRIAHSLCCRSTG
jgi:hypothetical protein